MKRVNTDGLAVTTGGFCSPGTTECDAATRDAASRTSSNTAAQAADTTFANSGSDLAPKCFYDAATGKTTVHYTPLAHIHPSFKCIHVDVNGDPATNKAAAMAGGCKCTTTHPNFHRGGCMQFDHVDGKTHSVSGDCTTAGGAPTSAPSAAAQVQDTTTTTTTPVPAPTTTTTTTTAAPTTTTTTAATTTTTTAFVPSNVRPSCKLDHNQWSSWTKGGAADYKPFGLLQESKKCIFPFKYCGITVAPSACKLAGNAHLVKTYNACTQKDLGLTWWCATEVDSDGFYKKAKYGRCNGQCGDSSKNAT
jgi:hypothetical protein